MVKHSTRILVGAICSLFATFSLVSCGEQKDQISGVANRQESSIRFSDNLVAPEYTKDIKAELSLLEEALLNKLNGEVSLTDYLKTHNTTQAVVRMVYGDAKTVTLYIATLFINESDARLEYIGYPLKYLSNDDRKQFMNLVQQKDMNAIAEKCLVWNKTLATVSRDMIVEELNRLDILSLISCKPAWTTPKTHIPNAPTPTPKLKQIGGESRYWDYPYRVFVAVRMPSGDISENRFSVHCPDVLADVRYELVLYVFSECEPLRFLFEAFEATKPETAEGIAPTPVK